MERRSRGLHPETLPRPDEFGIVPTGYRLPAHTRLGSVRLQVRDLDRSLAYYSGVLGFDVLRATDTGVELGVRSGSEALIELVEGRGITPARRRGRLGLYHFAVLLPRRADLGRLLAHLTAVGELVGGADHRVCEAIYVQDPDGLTVEISVDRARERWPKRGAELRMETGALDRSDLIAAGGAERWHGVPPGTRIGHLHLHVGELEAAVEFYHLGLGMDLTAWSLPGALFLAAGGYHHHLGVNTWAGARAEPSLPDEARLLRWELVMPTHERVAEAAASLATTGTKVERREMGWVAEDPWGNRFRCRAAKPTVRRHRAPAAAGGSFEGPARP